MTSIRTTPAGCFIAVLLMVSGCSTRDHQPTVTAGTALAQIGPQQQGTFGIDDVKAGSFYRFAFPPMQNTSHEPIQVTGFAMVSASATARIDGFAIFKTSAKDGYSLDSRDDTGDVDDMTLKQQYPISVLTIATGTTSDYYVMVRATVTGTGVATMHGCRISYTQQAKRFTQVFPCQFELDAN